MINLKCEILPGDTLEAQLGKLESWHNWRVTDELFSIAARQRESGKGCAPGIYEAHVIPVTNIWTRKFPVPANKLFEHVSKRYTELPVEVVACLGTQLPNTSEMRSGLQKIVGFATHVGGRGSVNIKTPMFWNNIHILTNPITFSALRRDNLAVSRDDLILVGVS